MTNPIITESDEQVIAWPQKDTPVEVFSRLYGSKKPYLVPLVVAHHRSGTEQAPHADRQEAVMYVLCQAYDASMQPARKFFTIIYYRPDPASDTFANGQHQRLLYHVYDERSNPSARECPLSILALLEPTDHPESLQWRSACWQFWQNKASRQRRDYTTLSFLTAIHNAEKKMIVCSHKGTLYVVSWIGEKPIFGKEGMPLLIARQSITWGVQIDARQWQDDLNPSTLEEAVHSLATQGIPLDTGWFIL